MRVLRPLLSVLLALAVLAALAYFAWPYVQQTLRYADTWGRGQE